MGLGLPQGRQHVFILRDPERAHAVGLGQLDEVGPVNRDRLQMIIEVHLLPLAHHAQVAVVDKGDLHRQLFFRERD